MSKLWALNVSFEQGERGYTQLKTALLEINLAHAFSEAAWVNASYTQNNKNFGGAPDIGPMGAIAPAVPEKRLQINMDRGYFVVIEQKGNDVSINQFTQTARGLLTYHEEGKVSDANGNPVAKTDGQTHRAAMTILDIAPAIMMSNLG